MRRFTSIQNALPRSSASSVTVLLCHIKFNSDCAEDKSLTEDTLLDDLKLKLISRDYTSAISTINRLKKIYKPDPIELQEWKLDLPLENPYWIGLGSLKFPSFLSSKKINSITDASGKIDKLLSQPSICA